MNTEQQEALLTIVLLAAFADGEKADAEREAIRRIAETLSGEAGSPNLTRLMQDVLLKRTSLASACARLTDTGQRQLAYEMAVSVCDADGQLTDTERSFLADLRGQLSVNASQAHAFEEQAEAMVAAVPMAPVAAASVAVASTPAAAAPEVTVRVNEAELDRTILNAALVNGALELLPQSWASMAIIPLQVRLVYNIGKAYGVTMDQGSIREFIAAAGVGLTSQYVEQFGRKLLGGLLGKMAGKTIGKIGSAGTGMAFSFASTYALGQLARRYYAGGRIMNTRLLQETYQGLLGPARQMQSQYLPQMQEKAASLDAAQIMTMVRGG